MDKNTFYGVRILLNSTKNRYLADWELVFNPTAIREGIIGEMGDKSYALLSAIASFMDETGHSCPTQRQLAEALKWSKTTVNTTMEKLLAFEWKGQKLIERELVGDGMKHSEYQAVTPEPQPGEQKPASPKEILAYFGSKYVEKYGTDYNFNWGKDTNIIKKKLIQVYPEDMVKQIIDVVFENFDDWSSTKYPRPTITALSTWCVNQAMVIIQAQEEQEKKVRESEQISTADLLAKAEAELDNL